MQVHKEAGVGGAVEVSAEDLALINKLSKKTLQAGEVYTFCVRLCDNQVDRDWEKFSDETLEELALLFVGKSGVFDHQWSARGQTARIYRAQVVQEQGGYRYVKAYAYMMRTAGNEDLIAEIEGGIKREVSVGCAVEKAVCSICGGEIGTCPHVKGERYDGMLCYAELRHATDAYEWSFVAVPAQPRAGVLSKGLDQDRAVLEKQAELGRKYLAALRADVVRLGVLAQPELKAGTLRTIAARLEEGELLALKGAYEAQAARKYPLRTQLPQDRDKAGTDCERDSAFLV